MSLTASEIDSLRYHLGYGNISSAAFPYSPDDFRDLFEQIVGACLSTGTETTTTTAITAGSSTTVTPASMTDIVVGAQLVVDVGEAAEVVMVRSTTLTTFTAAFTLAHPASGYPVMLMCGKARLRYLLGACDRLWQRTQSASVSGALGIKQLGQGEIEWFGPNSVYQGLLNQYLGVVSELSSLVRIPANPETRSAGGTSEVAVY